MGNYLPFIAALLGVAALFLLFRGFKQLEKRRAAEVLEKLRGKELLGFSSNANFMGHTSARLPRMRGNGVLALTADELIFEMWKPERSMSVPVRSIERASKVRSFRGRTKGVPMVQVDFVNDINGTDSFAFIVRHPETWMRALAKISAESRPG